MGIGVIGVFYILTTFFGFGAATILEKSAILTEKGAENTNMVAPILAKALGGELFFAFISAVAFATILAVVAGLTMSASTSFAHGLLQQRDEARGRDGSGDRGQSGPHHRVLRRCD